MEMLSPYKFQVIDSNSDLQSQTPKTLEYRNEMKKKNFGEFGKKAKSENVIDLCKSEMKFFEQ